MGGPGSGRKKGGGKSAKASKEKGKVRDASLNRKGKIKRGKGHIFLDGE